MTKPWEETWWPADTSEGIVTDGPSVLVVSRRGLWGSERVLHDRTHLIAAAPELYRAVEAMLNATLEDEFAAEERARAALRKARGET